MKQLTKRRFLAFGIDYLIIILYLVLLVAITILIRPEITTVYEAQIVGFLTLTLPVFLYFYLCEKYWNGSTIGKKKMHVVVEGFQKNNSGNLFVRNVLKFLPWEIAHFGIHHLKHFVVLDFNPPAWIWVALIVPQIIVIGYLVSIILSNGQSSFYDKIAQTKIILR